MTLARHVRAESATMGRPAARDRARSSEIYPPACLAPPSRRSPHASSPRSAKGGAGSLARRRFRCAIYRSRGRRRSTGMYKKVMLAYDGSLEGAVALREGAILAKKCGAEVFLLSVVPHLAGLQVAEGVHGGVVAHELDRREDVDADLVVVGHRKRNRLERWWSATRAATSATTSCWSAGGRATRRLHQRTSVHAADRAHLRQRRRFEHEYAKTVRPVRADGLISQTIHGPACRQGLHRRPVGRRGDLRAHALHPHPQQVAGVRPRLGGARPHGGGGRSCSPPGPTAKIAADRAAPASRSCAWRAARR